MKKVEIELSSIEATAYWWVNTVRSKVREIMLQGAENKSELRFAEIFNRYTEIEWRKLYLELIKYITEDVNNYVPRGNTMSIDSFSQDTDKLGHARLKAELSKITNCRVPDIRLASSSTKDSVIYTNMFGACVWYKSCGVTNLPTKYEPSYVLTGDEKELNFYYLLLATVYVLRQEDKKFKSVSILRERFCKEYIEMNALKDNLEDIEEMFNHSFEKASDSGIILGRYYRESYFAHFYEMDLVGLDSYMEMARYYADVVLSRVKVEDKTAYRKVLRRKKDKSY